MKRSEIPANGVGYGEFHAPVEVFAGWPVGWALVQCGFCGATWIGPLDEPCGWCIRRVGAIVEAQKVIDQRAIRSAA